MTEQEAERLASLPPEQQKAIIQQLTGRIIERWGALPLDEPKPA